MPHLLGPAGAQSPPSRNEVLLREALDRLRAQLDECRTQRDELAFAVWDLLSWAKRRHGGDLGLHPEEYFRTTEHAQRVLADYAPEETQ